MVLGWFQDAVNNVNLVDLIIAFVLVVVMAFLCYKKERGYQVFIVFAILFVLLVIASALNYMISIRILQVIFLVATLSYFTYSFNDFTKLFEKIGKRNKNKNKNSDQQKIYEIINEAVMALSETKTGAIITIEKGESLEEYCAKGSLVDAPVSSDLLRTIFYEGTPLHDGAVIIRNNRIAAASVYYTPTTQALNGHFGARHRAAVGFSETHHSITVIVSEETGRISFAVEGELISVSRDAFFRRLSDYLD